MEIGLVSFSNEDDIIFRNKKDGCLIEIKICIQWRQRYNGAKYNKVNSLITFTQLIFYLLFL